MNSDFTRAGIVIRFAVALAMAAWTGSALAQAGITTTSATGDSMAGILAGSGQVSLAAPHRYADIVLEGDQVTGVYTFAPQPTDVGKSATLHVVAKVVEGNRERWFSLAGDRWIPWSGRSAELPAAATRVLGVTETVNVLQQQALFAGDYSIYAGYRAADGMLHYGQTPLNFAVQSGSGEALHRFSSAAAMEAWLKAGLQATTSPGYFYAARSLTPALDSVASNGSSIAARTSATNIQEAGVDEADIIKVAGAELYALKNCELSPCLEVYELDSSNAAASLVTSYKLGSSQGPDGMYLVENGILGQRMLVTVAGQNQFWNWFSIGGWQEGKTELEFLNISTPASISSIEKLTLDGALVASRRVGDMLYVVTRYTPAIDGFYPYPVARDLESANASALESATLPQILPRIIDSRDEVQALVESKDCYLPTSAVDGGLNPSIITITGIRLSAPTARSSTCFVGASETLFMTTDSLYLATTSWDYAMLASDDLRYSPDHTTAIHKFALSADAIEYRGSGTVAGHLGWTEDKKSFRMGENGAYLNIVTSIGDSWRDDSSTSLTVLKETADSKNLQTVSRIDGIGKPGEQLYAARFIGDRAYLVTFRITDPLYVVDLSSQENPRIAGELEIAGYSDYLHPVSENLLLGIGKDAIPDDRASDFGAQRGAWYQGVKVALFDVSDPARPSEIDSLVLGKRGTESEVLWDHHAFSYVPAVGNEPARFAIPVQLHDRTPTWGGFSAGSPAAWYDYTHTGLYSFEVSEQGISQAGRIIAQENTGTPGRPVPLAGRIGVDVIGTSLPGFAPYFKYYGDRSVLMDEAVFYLHDGKLHSALWGQSKTP